MISLLVGALNAATDADSITVHTAGETQAVPDFSECSSETRESATGVFHHHVWPKISQKIPSSYEVTNCLEKSPSGAHNGRDYEIVVQIISKVCTFKLSHDPKKPITEQDLQEDIQRQVEACEASHAVHQDDGTTIVVQENPVIHQEEETPLVHQEEETPVSHQEEETPVVHQEEETPIINENEDEEITDEQAPWVKDLLKEESNFDAEMRDKQDKENKDHEIQFAGTFNKKHALALGEEFGPFAQDVNEEDLEEEVNEENLEEEVHEENLEEEVHEEDLEEEVNEKDLETEFKKSLSSGSSTASRHSKFEESEDEEEDEEDEEEERRYLEEQREQIKNNHASQQKESVPKTPVTEEEEEELPSESEFVHFDTESEGEEEEEEHSDHSSHSDLNKSRVSFGSSDFGSESEEFDLGEEFNLAGEEHYFNANHDSEEEDNDSEYDPEEEERYLKEVRAEIEKKKEELQNVEELHVPAEKKEEIKDNLENEILDATAAYMKQLHERALHHISLEEEANEAPAKITEDSEPTPSPLVNHEEEEEELKEEEWDACPYPEHLKTMGYFNELINGSYFEPFVIYKQNIKGCAIREQIFKFTLSFDGEVCNFLVKKNDKGEVELINNDALWQGACAHLIGSRLTRN